MRLELSWELGSSFLRRGGVEILWYCTVRTDLGYVVACHGWWWGRFVSCLRRGVVVAVYVLGKKVHI